MHDAQTYETNELYIYMTIASNKRLRVTNEHLQSRWVQTAAGLELG